MRRHRQGRPAWFLVLVVAASCTGRDAPLERYRPDAAVARAALDQALAAWQRGDALPLSGEAAPGVHVVDTHRTRGQRLERYEIVGELPDDNVRRFAVRLTLASPAAQRTVCYMIVGIEPIWVFHEDDLAMVSHWECPMPETASSAQAGASTASAEGR
jgi:hypothetical protein